MSGGVTATRHVAIRGLFVQDFRNHASSSLECTTPMVALWGANGAGKTNLLEALSLFAQGRGMRRADPKSLPRRGSQSGYALSLHLVEEDQNLHLGLGFRPEGQEWTRLVRRQGEAVSSTAAFAEDIRPLWLTPTMDSLFRETPGERRRFLDRLVLGLDPRHSGRVQAYERAMSARNKILEEGGMNAWLEAAEAELATRGQSLWNARVKAVEALKSTLNQQGAEQGFPKADLALEADASQIEAMQDTEAYRERLARGREIDRAAGRTLFGPHTVDVHVHHVEKAMPAAMCSTGEQKALLVGVILAHARLVATQAGLAPTLLLDEVLAHLDGGRRAHLIEQLHALGASVWMTGTDPELFEAMQGFGTWVHVNEGALSVGSTTWV